MPRGHAVADFRYDDTTSDPGTLYLLEINTQPGMTPTSLVPEQAAYRGISFPDLVARMVEGAQCDVLKPFSSAQKKKPGRGKAAVRRHRPASPWRGTLLLGRRGGGRARRRRRGHRLDRPVRVSRPHLGKP
ncbi:MAG: hypothetical protein ACMVO3_22165 [Thalassobaculum sp.]